MNLGGKNDGKWVPGLSQKSQSGKTCTDDSNPIQPAQNSNQYIPIESNQIINQNYIPFNNPTNKLSNEQTKNALPNPFSLTQVLMESDVSNKLNKQNDQEIVHSGKNSNFNNSINNGSNNINSIDKSPVKHLPSQPLVMPTPNNIYEKYTHFSIEKTENNRDNKNSSSSSSNIGSTQLDHRQKSKKDKSTDFLLHYDPTEINYDEQAEQFNLFMVPDENDEDNIQRLEKEKRKKKIGRFNLFGTKVTEPNSINQDAEENIQKETLNEAGVITKKPSISYYFPGGHVIPPLFSEVNRSIKKKLKSRMNILPDNSFNLENIVQKREMLGLKEKYEFLLKSYKEILKEDKGIISEEQTPISNQTDILKAPIIPNYNSTSLQTDNSDNGKHLLQSPKEENEEIDFDLYGSESDNQKTSPGFNTTQQDKKQINDSDDSNTVVMAKTFNDLNNELVSPPIVLNNQGKYTTARVSQMPTSTPSSLIRKGIVNSLPSQPQSQKMDSRAYSCEHNDLLENGITTDEIKKTIEVKEKNKAEKHLARKLQVLGAYPNNEEIAISMHEYILQLSEMFMSSSTNDLIKLVNMFQPVMTPLCTTYIPFMSDYEPCVYTSKYSTDMDIKLLSDITLLSPQACMITNDATDIHKKRRVDEKTQTSHKSTLAYVQRLPLHEYIRPNLSLLNAKFLHNSTTAQCQKLIEKLKYNYNSYVIPALVFCPNAIDGLCTFYVNGNMKDANVLLTLHIKECNNIFSKCPHSKDGCTFPTSTKEKLREHLISDCYYAIICCENKCMGCTFSGPRKLVLLHQTACPFKPKVCVKCGRVLPQDQKCECEKNNVSENILTMKGPSEATLSNINNIAANGEDSLLSNLQKAYHDETDFFNSNVMPLSPVHASGIVFTDIGLSSNLNITNKINRTKQEIQKDDISDEITNLLSTNINAAVNISNESPTKNSINTNFITQANGINNMKIKTIKSPTVDSIKTITPLDKKDIITNHEINVKENLPNNGPLRNVLRSVNNLSQKVDSFNSIFSQISKTEVSILSENSIDGHPTTHSTPRSASPQDSISALITGVESNSSINLKNKSSINEDTLLSSPRHNSQNNSKLSITASSTTLGNKTIENNTKQSQVHSTETKDLPATPINTIPKQISSKKLNISNSISEVASIELI